MDGDLIYGYSRRIENELKKLGQRVGERNREVLLRFYRHMVAEGLSKARIWKCLSTLRRLAELLGKPFEEATKDDIVELIAKIERRDYAEWTKHDYKVILRKFYKWLRGTDDYPPEVRWIRVKYSIPSRLRKKDLLTVEEIRRMADCAENVRDKAFIWVYFDSMRRLGEILSLRIGDVEFDDLGAKLYVRGKVGPDQARITFSVPLLLAWLSVHPFRDDPEAPLWVTLDSRERPKPLGYRCVHRMIVKCAKKTGIGKRVWPYLIRHSRITLRARSCRTRCYALPQDGSRAPGCPRSTYT